jgi:hypothetical protein
LEGLGFDFFFKGTRNFNGCMAGAAKILIESYYQQEHWIKQIHIPGLWFSTFFKGRKSENVQHAKEIKPWL